MSGGKLKPGWKVWRFDQIATNVNVRIDNPSESGMEHYVGLEHLDPDSLRIRRWGSPDDVEATKLCFKSGDIIFGRRRAYQRKLGVAEFDGICSAHAMVLRAKPEVVLPEFLPFFMQSDLFMNRAVEISVGSLSPTINWKTLAAQKFPIPSLTDQATLVTCFNEVEKTISNYSDALAAAAKLFRAIHASLFADILAETSGKKLMEQFNLVADKGFTGLPILSVTIDGKVVRRDSLERHVSDETGDEKYIRVQPNDIVYNTMRLWQGAIGIVSEEGLISPAYTVLRLKDGSDSIDYWWQLFRSPVVVNEYRRFVKGVAKDRWRIYFKDLQHLEVAIPSHQDRAQIAKRLSSILDCKEALVRRRLDLLAMRGGIIEAGFGGAIV